MARQYKRQSMQSSAKTWVWRGISSTWVAFAAIAFTVIAFNHLGFIEHALDFLGRDYINQANTRYLHEAKTQMAESITILAALDTTLEVLKSSSVGISFIASVKVQVGNIVSAIQDFTAKALAASLLAAGSLLLTELILDVARILAKPLLTLTILLVGIYFAARGHLYRIASIAGQLSSVFLLLTFLVHFGLPLAIYGTSVASNTLTATMADNAHTHFAAAHTDFSQQREQMIDDHVKKVIERYEHSSDTHHKSSSFASSAIRHVLAVILNTLIFPLLLVGIILWSVRIIVRHILKVEDMMNLEANKRLIRQSSEWQ